MVTTIPWEIACSRQQKSPPKIDGLHLSPLSLAFIADKSLAFVAYKSEAFVLGSFFLQSEQHRQVVGEAALVTGALVGALGALAGAVAVVGEEMVEA